MMGRLAWLLFALLVGCAPAIYYTKELVREDWQCDQSENVPVNPPPGYSWNDLIEQRCYGRYCTTCWAHSKIIKVQYLFRDCPEREP